MNTLDNFKAEIESGMANLSKAAGPVMEKFGQAVDVSNLRREMNEHHKRLLALPPNLRSVVCAGIEISLAEKVYAEHGRDLTGQEAWGEFLKIAFGGLSKRIGTDQ